MVKKKERKKIVGYKAPACIKFLTPWAWGSSLPSSAFLVTHFSLPSPSWALRCPVDTPDRLGWWLVLWEPATYVAPCVLRGQQSLHPGSSLETLSTSLTDAFPLHHAPDQVRNKVVVGRIHPFPLLCNLVLDNIQKNMCNMNVTYKSC